MGELLQRLGDDFGDSEEKTIGNFSFESGRFICSIDMYHEKTAVGNVVLTIAASTPQKAFFSLSYHT